MGHPVAQIVKRINSLGRLGRLVPTIGLLMIILTFFTKNQNVFPFIYNSDHFWFLNQPFIGVFWSDVRPDI